MKKILIIHHRDVFSGAEKVLIDTFSQYENEGYTITNLVPQKSNLYDIYIENGLNCIQSKNLIGFSEANMLSYINHYFRFTKEILILSKDYDVVVANTFYASLKLILFNFLSFRSKKIALLHDIFSNPFLKIFLKILYLPYHNLVVVSNATQELNRLYSKKVKVIYNGINLEPLKFKKIENRNVAVVGLLDEWKGQLNLIKKTKTNRMIYLVGNDKNIGYRDKILNLALDNVVITGMKKSPWEYISEKNIYFTINCSIQHDPLPTVVLESISNNLIPFVTSLGGGKEMIPDNLYENLVIDFTSKRQIIKMYNFIDQMNDEEYLRIVKRLRKFIQLKFSIEIKRSEFNKLLLEE